MRKITTLACILIISAGMLKAQYSQEWFSHYIRPFTMQMPKVVKIMSSGDNIYLLATVQGAVMNDVDMALAKFDSEGKLVWEKIYTVPGNFMDEAIDMDLDNRGNVYVAVASAPEKLKTAVDFCTIKYSTDGSESWTRRWGTTPHAEIPSGIKVSNGMVFVSGTSVHTAGGATAEDFHSKIYNAETGNEIWSHSWNGTAGDRRNYATAMTLDKMNNLVVVGRSEYPNDDYSIIRYRWDTIPPKTNKDSTRIVLVFDWERKHNGPANQLDKAQYVTTDLSGNIYVTGNAFSKEGKQDIVTIKYDSKGNKKWEASINGTANNRDEPIAIEIDSKGNVLVTGYQRNLKTAEDFVTVKYTSDGETVWSSFQWDMSTETAMPADMALDQGDHVFVLGIAGKSKEVYVRRISPEGKIVWETNVRPPGLNIMPGQAHKLCIDQRGNLYVAGLDMTAKGGPQLFLSRYVKN